MNLEELLMHMPPHQLVRLHIYGELAEPKEYEALCLIELVQYRHRRVGRIYVQNGILTIDVGMI